MVDKGWRSKIKWVHFWKKWKDVPFQPLYQTNVRYSHIGDKKMKKLFYCFAFIKEINGSLDTKMTVTPLLFDFQKISWNYGARERGDQIQISDGMFGWYVLVGQPLAYMKMLLLSVPSGWPGHMSRSKVKWVHFQKIKKMFLSSYCIN